MLLPTANITEAEIIKADKERAEWAWYLALCEMMHALMRVPADDIQAYDRWRRAVNSLAQEKFMRLN